MLIFLYGKNTYLLQRKLKEIEQQYKKVHGNALNLEKLDASEISFKGFSDALKQQSMFIKKKMFFLENVFSSEGFKKALLNHLEAISKSQNVLVLIEKGQPSKADKLFQALQKTAKCQGFEGLSGIKLRNWVKKEFAGYGVEIEPLALAQLISFVGDDLWQMSQEIKKLSSYKLHSPTSSGRSGLVEAEDVRLFVRPKIPAEIFKTIDALAQGNKSSALCMLQAHMDKGDSPFYLLKMLAWQFRNLLLVKASPQSSRAFMKPFVFRKTMALSQRFSQEQLKKIFHKIFEADLAIKTGKISPEVGLRMLIAAV